MTGTEISPVLRIGRQFTEVMKKDDTYRDAWFKILLVELLLIIVENWQNSDDHIVPTDDFFSINNALKLIFSSKEYVDVDRAATACGMSRRSFDREFRSAMGISFAKFPLRHRLSGVAERLINSTEPVKTIALARRVASLR